MNQTMDESVVSVMQATIASLNRDNYAMKHTLMRIAAQAEGLLITPVTVCESHLLRTIQYMASIAERAANDYQ